MAKFSGSSIVSIIFSLIILFVLIYNVIYIGGVRSAIQKGADVGLSSGAANFLFWLDIVLIGVVLLYILYTVFIIFTTSDERQMLTQSLVQSQAGLGTTLRPMYYPKQD